MIRLLSFFSFAFIFGAFGAVLSAQPLADASATEIDSTAYYRDSIKWGSDYRKKADFIEKALVFSQRERDTLAWYSFRLEQANFLFMQGRYLDAYDTLMVLEQAVAAYMGRPSLAEEGEQPPFEVRSVSDSLWRELHVGIARVWVQTDTYLREFTEAMDVVAVTRAVYSEDSTDLIAGYCYNAMGVIFARNNKSESAEAYYRQALDVFARHEEKEWQAVVYVNLAYTYIVLGKTDSALQCALESYAILKKMSSRKDKYINSELCLALAYRSLQQYKLAEAYLLTALRDAEEWQCGHLLLYIRNNLVGMFLETGQYDRAEPYAQVNLQAAREAADVGAEEFVLLQLARIYEMKGDCTRSLDYLDQTYQVSQKKILDEENSRLTYLQRKFDSYRQVQEKWQYEQTLELTNAKLRNSLLATGIVVLLGMGLAVVVWVMYRRLRVQRRMNRLIRLRLDESETQSQDRMEDMQMHIRQVLDDKRKALSEKDRELTAMALYITKVDGLTESLGEKLRAMRVTGNLKTKEKMYVAEMESLLKSFAPDKNWNEFELYFKEVDPAFFEKLEAKYPDLTPNEKRLCALVHLNLTSKEIASITSRTYRSVSMAKTRLKKKFGCPPDRRLYDFLMQL